MRYQISLISIKWFQFFITVVEFCFVHCRKIALKRMGHCIFFFSEICWGKAMVAYTNPQQRKKEERERLSEERGIRSRLLILDLKNAKL